MGKNPKVQLLPMSFISKGIKGVVRYIAIYTIKSNPQIRDYTCLRVMQRAASQ